MRNGRKVGSAIIAIGVAASMLSMFSKASFSKREALGTPWQTIRGK